MISLAILAAIKAHRLAIVRDEALYGEGGNPLVGLDELDTSDEEIAARFLTFASAPCFTPEDVQLKVDYVLNGAIGLRDAAGWDDEFVDSLTGTGAGPSINDPAGPLVQFLRSIRIADRSACRAVGPKISHPAQRDVANARVETNGEAAARLLVCMDRRRAAA